MIPSVTRQCFFLRSVRFIGKNLLLITKHFRNPDINLFIWTKKQKTFNKTEIV